MDTLGHLLALIVTSGDEQDRAQDAELAARVQEVTGENVGLAFVDQDSTGEAAAEDAAAYELRLEVVKLPEAKRGFVLLPRRWAVERSPPGQRALGSWRVLRRGCLRWVLL